MSILLLPNDFAAKAYFLNMPTQPDFDFINNELHKVWNNNTHGERLLSAYFFNKCLFDKYLNCPDEDVISTMYKSTEDLLFFIEDFFRTLKNEVYRNKFSIDFLNLIKNDDSCLARLLNINHSYQFINSFGFYIYFATNNINHKKKIKDMIIDKVGSEINIVNFKNMSSSFKDEFFAESEKQFLIDIYPYKVI